MKPSKDSFDNREFRRQKIAEKQNKEKRMSHRDRHFHASVEDETDVDDEFDSDYDYLLKGRK